MMSNLPCRLRRLNCASVGRSSLLPDALVRYENARFLLAAGFWLLASLSGCHPDKEQAGTPPANYPQAVALFYKGLISLEVSDDGNAAKVLPQNAQLIPQEPAAWANLGLFQLRQGHFDEARKSLETAQNLAPKNGPIAALLGLLESRQGHFAEAVTDYKNAVALTPDDLRARYALIEALGQQAGSNAAKEIGAQMDALAQAAPDNLFVEFERLLAAAKSSDAAAIKAVMAKFAAQSSAWPADAKQAFKDAQTATSGDPRGLVGSATGLRHTLESWPEYQRQKAEIVPPAGVVGTPVDRFLVLPAPSPTPAPPDMALTYQSAPAQNQTPMPPLPPMSGRRAHSLWTGATIFIPITAMRRQKGFGFTSKRQAAIKTRPQNRNCPPPS